METAQLFFALENGAPEEDCGDQGDGDVIGQWSMGDVVRTCSCFLKLPLAGKELWGSVSQPWPL